MNAERNNAGSSAAPGESTGGGTVVVQGGDSRHSPPNQQQQQHPSQQQQQQQQIHIRHSVSFLDFSSHLTHQPFHGREGAALCLYFFSSLWEAFLFFRNMILILIFVYFQHQQLDGRQIEGGVIQPVGQVSYLSHSTRHKRFSVAPGRELKITKELGEALVIFGNFLFSVLLAASDSNLSIGI